MKQLKSHNIYNYEDIHLPLILTAFLLQTLKLWLNILGQLYKKKNIYK